LEFVAALCIAGSLGWGAVALAAGDLDDHAGIVEQEVHAGERAAIASMDHLGARPPPCGCPKPWPGRDAGDATH
jgi:hypothetical protein